MMTLKTEDRDVFGKKIKYFVKEGKMPAVIYGSNKKNRSVFVPLNDFMKAFKRAGKSEIIKLDLGNAEENVLIYDIQKNPLSGAPIHADFFVVAMDKPISVSIQLKFAGESEAVKSLGGVLIKVMHDLEIEALPSDIPHELEINISKLKNLEDKILIGDVKLPKGVKIKASAEEIVALVESPREEEITEGPAKIDFEKIEVEKRGKKEKEEEDATE